MSEFNWTCPFCQYVQTVDDSKYNRGDLSFYVGDTKFASVGAQYVAIGCSNPDCKEFTVSIDLVTRITKVGGGTRSGKILSSHRLRPEYFAKPLPDYITAPIREDYYEACKIRDLSPKASATLSRRCLQGIIRDFCKIKADTLFKEIEQLEKMSKENTLPNGVSDESIQSFHDIRKIGNIGAHMEGDIDVILPVEPEEAQILINLIETLIEDWYTARHNRQQRRDALKSVVQSKEALRQAQPTEEKK